MVTYLKKTILIFLALLTLIRPLPALGVDLGSALDSLLGSGSATSVNQPGRFQSGARNMYSGGGFDMRVPRANQTPSLFSFTPPSFSAGCNGISAHFGGWSFITGEQFEKMIKSIGTGVIVGFIVQMAIKITCPQCEDVINKLRQAAELAAKLAIDGCNAGFAIGAALADAAYNKMNPPQSPGKDEGKTSSTKEKCSQEAQNIGDAGDALDALWDKCKSMEKAFSYLVNASRKAMGLSSTDPKMPDLIAKKACELGGSGNLTWLMLRALDDDRNNVAYYMGNSRDRKILYMNMLGVKMSKGISKADSDAAPMTTLSCVMPDGSTTRYADPDAFCPPTLSPDDSKSAETLAAIIMCGTETTPTVTYGDGEYIKSFCKDYARQFKDGDMSSPQLPKLYTCGVVAGGDTSDTAFTNCSNVVLDDFKNIYSGSGLSKGFLVRIHDILYWGMKKIAANESILDGSTNSKYLINLINVAPFPIYQAMNAAAIYPSAAQDILNSMGILIAQQLAVSQLEELIRLNGRTGASFGCASIDPAMILAVTSKTRARLGEFKAEFAKNYAVQQALVEQIRTLNIAIQKQVLSNDMLQSAKASQSINKGVSNVAVKP